MSVVRQQAFVQQPGVREKQQPTGRPSNSHDGSLVDVAAHLPQLHDAGAEREGRGRGQNQQEGTSDSMVDALAYQIGNLDKAGLDRAVRNLNRVARSSAIPTDSPLWYVGPTARNGFQRGSLLRDRYSHAPWRAGRDGANLTTAGKPFAFQSPGYAAGNRWNPSNSDIPEAWVKENLEPEIYNNLVNEKKYNRQLLAQGRYSLVRV